MLEISAPLSQSSRLFVSTSSTASSKAVKCFQGFLLSNPSSSNVITLYGLCVFSGMALQQSASLKWLFCSPVKECSFIPIQTPLATAAILPNSAKSFPSKKVLGFECYLN